MGSIIKNEVFKFSEDALAFFEISPKFMTYTPASLRAFFTEYFKQFNDIEERKIQTQKVFDRFIKHSSNRRYQLSCCSKEKILEYLLIMVPDPVAIADILVMFNAPCFGNLCDYLCPNTTI